MSTIKPDATSEMAILENELLDSILELSEADLDAELKELGLDPSHQEALARAALGKGVKAAGKAALDKANNPDQAQFFPYLTGYVAFYTGDYKTAITDLKTANQNDPLILALLAEAYEKSGDATQASDYYRKVLALNSHNPTNAFARPLARKKLAVGS